MNCMILQSAQSCGNQLIHRRLTRIGRQMAVKVGGREKRIEESCFQFEEMTRCAGREQFRHCFRFGGMTRDGPERQGVRVDIRT